MAARKAFLLRINENLHKELEAWAQEEFRSVNGQIEFLLRQQVLKLKGDLKAREPDSSSGEESR